MMGVEGLDQVADDSTAEPKKTEREDPVAAHERKQSEREAARRARSERLGHEIFEEKKETESKKTTKKKEAAESGTSE